jgi:hypothetical protein
MQGQKLSMQCPSCGSAEIVYSCEPKCCFNHVCADCTTAFYPFTTRTGQRLPGVSPPDPLPDCTEPTVACARCESTAVFALADGRLVCTACGEVLTMALSEAPP